MVGLMGVVNVPHKRARQVEIVNTSVVRTAEGVEVTIDDKSIFISAQMLEHSELLSNAFNDCGTWEGVVLPCSIDLLEAWLAFNEDLGTGDDVYSVVDAIQAADALIDVKGTKLACQSLANILFADDHTVPDNSREVLAALSEDLTMAVFRHAPGLSHLFRSLPRYLHPLALRAHHPSIDSHHHLTMPTLSTLHLVDTALTAAASLTSLRHLALSLRHRRSLANPHSVVSDACCAIVQACGRLTSLTALHLKGQVDRFHAADVDAAPSDALEASFAAALQPLASLRELHLCCMAVSFLSAAPHLPPSLTSLSLDLSSSITDSSARALAQRAGDLHSLRTLTLTRCGVTFAGWLPLAVAMAPLPLLEEVFLGHIDRGRRGGAAVILPNAGGRGSWPALRRVEALHCAAAPLLGPDAEPGSQLNGKQVAVPQLQHVTLGQPVMAPKGSADVDGIAKMLHDSGRAELETLELRGLQCSRGGAVLAAAVQGCLRGASQLRVLEVVGVRVDGMDVYDTLARGLASLQGLRVLKVSDNTVAGTVTARSSFERDGMATSGHRGSFAAFCCALRLLQGLEELCVAACGLEREEIGVLGAVGVLPRLTRLDLARNWFGAGAEVALAAWLGQLSELRDVRLQGNVVEVQGMRVLEECLLGLRKLETVELGDNCVPVEEMEEVVTVLRARGVQVVGAVV